MGATFIIQGAHNANGDGLSKNGKDAANTSYFVDLEIEKNFLIMERFICILRLGR